MKSQFHIAANRITRRPTPHGVGGLKCRVSGLRHRSGEVPPRTGWVD